MTKTFGTFQAAAAIDCVLLIDPAALFQQGHLGREVISLDDLDRVATSAETDVISATVCARSMQPERVHKTFDFLIHLGELPQQVRGMACVDAHRSRGFTARKPTLDND